MQIRDSDDEEVGHNKENIKIRQLLDPRKRSGDDAVLEALGAKDKKKKKQGREGETLRDKGKKGHSEMFDVLDERRKFWDETA